MMILTLLLAGAVSPTEPASDLTKLADPAWRFPRAAIELSNSAENLAGLEFSTNSDYLCISFLPEPPVGDLRKVPLRSLVYNLHGQLIREATNESGRLEADFENQFPKTSERDIFPDFLTSSHETNVAFWNIFSDRKLGVRFVKRRDDLLAPGAAELWQLTPERRRLWSTTVPNPDSQLGTAGFYSEQASNYVIVALVPSQAFIFRRDDGRIADQFAIPPFGNRSGTGRRQSDRSLAAIENLGEMTGLFAFDGELGLLACGAAEGCKISVFAIDRPHRILFSANTKVPRNRPLGGEWHVARLEFYARRYLLVGSSFAGRLTKKTYDPVQVFDTKRWKLVWFANSPTIQASLSPVISPDGKLMALIRGSRIEIGDFAHDGK